MGYNDQKPDMTASLPAMALEPERHQQDDEQRHAFN